MTSNDPLDLPEALVLDASILVAPVRADRLDVLAEILEPYDCLTTRAVREEVARVAPGLPTERLVVAPWLREVAVDGLDALRILIEWQARFGSGEHHLGETSVATHATRTGCRVACDDREARMLMRAQGLV